MDNMDRDEKVWGGIFGIIAIVAAIAEIFINGVDAASIVGAIKDVSGTLVVVVLLVAFIKSLPKKPKNFRDVFEKEMNEIEQAYVPLIVKYVPKDTAKDSSKTKHETVIRYDILSSVDALFGKEQADHLRLFELNAEKPEKMSFYIREKFFGKPFDAKEIAESISGRLQAKFPEYKVTHAADSSGETIIVNFNKAMETQQDATALVNLINAAILLFVARNKKSLWK